MFDRILRQMRELVRRHQYILTVHAEDEMEADGLNVFDIEECVLSGRITERQKDRMTGEWKYVVHGPTMDGSHAGVVAKIGPTRKLIVLTAYAL